MSCDNKELELLQGAVRAVARNGLENTTTRSIGAEAGIDDAYIYRYFKDKEELICRAFSRSAKRTSTGSCRALKCSERMRSQRRWKIEAALLWPVLGTT